MIGRFTETREFENIKNHLLQGRIVFAFTGTGFILIHYDVNEEKGITRGYSLTKDMDIEVEVHNFFNLLNSIKNNMINDDYHHLLYYGELTVEDGMSEFMREFYNPSEELPLIVATTMFDSDTINVGVTHSGNIKGKIVSYVDEFLQTLVDKYLIDELSASAQSIHNIFSFWVVMKENKYEIEFRSRYSEIINDKEELKNNKDLITAELNLELIKLGVFMSADKEHKSTSNF